jgi:uncharacterized membrane protein YuzA (DUF378 family)
MKQLKPVGAILLIIGGINWGLIGLSWFVAPTSSWTGWNLVHVVLGQSMQLEGIVYILVGAAAVWALLDWKKMMNM